MLSPKNRKVYMDLPLPPPQVGIQGPFTTKRFSHYSLTYHTYYVVNSFLALKFLKDLNELEVQFYHMDLPSNI
jgi:hypothetical protein